MNTSIKLLRLKNRVMARVAPKRTTLAAARQFLTPRRYPLKDWEHQAEQSCRRHLFCNGLSAARWGQGGRKVLLVHGWESRATQMFGLVSPLLERGFEVVAIDGPMHGHSGGDRANAVAFANAIQCAQRELGPFFGAIGHSMGAAAIALAMESGIRFERCVLIASPATFEDKLASFADFVGLAGKNKQRFMLHVEAAVGRPAKSLDVGRIFAELKPDVLLVHDRFDPLVPYNDMKAIRSSYPGLRAYTTENLGHHKIVRSPEIARRIGDYLAFGSHRSEPAEMAYTHQEGRIGPWKKIRTAQS